MIASKKTWHIGNDPSVFGTVGQKHEWFTFTETGTSGSQPPREDNSTSQQPIPETLERAITELFDSAEGEAFEYGYSSNFATSLEAFIQIYSVAAVQAIQQHILLENVGADVATEALHTLGRTRHQPSHLARLNLLLSSLFASSARIRCGAAMGLAYLDDPRAVPFLHKAINQETPKASKVCLQRVLEQLEDTQRHV